MTGAGTPGAGVGGPGIPGARDPGATTTRAARAERAAVGGRTNHSSVSSDDGPLRARSSSLLLLREDHVLVTRTWSSRSRRSGRRVLLQELFLYGRVRHSRRGGSLLGRGRGRPHCPRGGLVLLHVHVVDLVSLVSLCVLVSRFSPRPHDSSTRMRRVVLRRGCRGGSRSWRSLWRRFCRGVEGGEDFVETCRGAEGRRRLIMVL